jgi:hypothetical protein
MSTYYHGTHCADIQIFKKDRTYVTRDMHMALWHARKNETPNSFIYVLELGESDVARKQALRCFEWVRFWDGELV